MASVIDEKEDSVVEGLRQSLLEVVEERHRTLNKKSLLHRMVIISKLVHQNFQEIGQYFETVFRDIQNNQQNDGATGLLLIYPRHSVHIVEFTKDRTICLACDCTVEYHLNSGHPLGSLELLLDLCQDLVQLSEGHIEKSRLLIVSHDVPHRLYQHWSFRVLDIEPPRLDEYEMNESADKLVAEMLIQLLKLGTYLARQPKVSLKNAMDFLQDKVPELLPQQDVIGYLLDTDDLPCISQPDDYLAIYRQPYDITLESELTWPMPVKLFPYN